MSHQEEAWLSILDYAQEKEISISTIRRHIKKGLLKTKLIKGKYFIRLKAIPRDKLRDTKKEEDELKRLTQLNRELTQEVQELKMLVDVYEDRKKRLPAIPVVP